jgi:hypothetical protein
MVSFIGDIGEAAADRTAAHAGVQEARDRATQLLDDARREGARLVAQAQEREAHSDDRYAEAFNRAVDEGWAVRLLTDLGYVAPARTAGRRRRSFPNDASSSSEPSSKEAGPRAA